MNRVHPAFRPLIDAIAPKGGASVLHVHDELVAALDEVLLALRIHAPEQERAIRHAEEALAKARRGAT